MTRIITIKGRTGLFDIPSFLLSENDDLQIRLDFSDEIRVGKFRVVVKHGAAEKLTFTLKQSGTINLPVAWLKVGGRENVEFSLILLNATETTVVKDDYQIEPLKVETVKGNFIFSTLMQELIKKQDRQDERLAELERRVAEYETNGVELVPENE